MNKDTQIQAITEKAEALIAEDPELFLVEVRIKPTHNIKVYIDGNQGISVDKLVQYNRRLYKIIEEAGYYPEGEFSLELSSPGLDEPLKLHRQYLKNVGRFVEVLLADGVKREGKLVSATETEIGVEEHKGKGKKAEMILHTIPFDQIKTTKIQIKF
ncbi:MAG: ribosome maturation factor [Chitinophagaceae bacterium]|nr:ribosome maturation factor [Chitinophagaceae bacterium]